MTYARSMTGLRLRSSPVGRPPDVPDIGTWQRHAADALGAAGKPGRSANPRKHPYSVRFYLTALRSYAGNSSYWMSRFQIPLNNDAFSRRSEVTSTCSDVFSVRARRACRLLLRHTPGTLRQTLVDRNHRQDKGPVRPGKSAGNTPCRAGGT